jgi:hypothetical protein
MMHKTTFELTLFDDESTDYDVKLYGAIDAMLDDSRNIKPEEYYWFVNELPPGTKVRMTLEEVPKKIPSFVATVRIKEGANIMQDRSFYRWPHIGERVENPEMLFTGEWNEKFWTCKADGYGHLKIDGDLGEYGSGSIFISSYDSVEIVNNEH